LFRSCTRGAHKPLNYATTRETNSLKLQAIEQKPGAKNDVFGFKELKIVYASAT
jgi:hypothetical protein